MARCLRCPEETLTGASAGLCASKEQCVGEGYTPWSGDLYCPACSDAKHVCEHCGATLVSTASQ